MAALNDILSPVWTFEKNGGGAIIEGVAAIRQSLDIIITTTKGSDPLRPDFGCDAMKYQDYPISVAGPLIVKALYDAITTWENRVTITKISSKLAGDSNLIFTIGYTLSDNISDELIVYSTSGVIRTNGGTTRLTLIALFPPNANNYPYRIDLTLNGNTAYPICPENGFATITDLFAWVNNNWSALGNWYLTSNSITGILNPNYTSGNISISLIPIRIIKTIIPTLPVGENYQVSVQTINGSYSNSGLYSTGQILGYVKSDVNLSALGAWSLASAKGDFNNDFNNDFEKQNNVLVLATTIEDEISIIINTVSN